MSIIQTVDLTKKFGDFTANDAINLSVDKQEIKCIVGENGAGKTTLMNMLYGLLRPTSGKILIRDQETVINSPVQAIANGLGMVHQHFKLVHSLTVYENIMVYENTVEEIGTDKFIAFALENNLLDVILVGLKDEVIKNAFIDKGLKVSCYVQFHLPADEVDYALKSNGFVYLQAVPAPGQADPGYPELKDCIWYLRSRGLRNPIYCGVGVHSPKDAAMVRTAGADGAFVGSAILKLHNDKPALMILFGFAAIFLGRFRIAKFGKAAVSLACAALVCIINISGRPYNYTFIPLLSFAGVGLIGTYLMMQRYYDNKRNKVSADYNVKTIKLPILLMLGCIIAVTAASNTCSVRYSDSGTNQISRNKSHNSKTCQERQKC